MKTNRHQLEIAGDRIGQAQGALAKTISVLHKYGLSAEGAEVGKMVGSLGNISVALAAKVKAVNEPSDGFVAGDIGQKPLAPKPVAAPAPAAAPAAPAPAATLPAAAKVETTAEGDTVPAAAQ